MTTLNTRTGGDTGKQIGKQLTQMKDMAPQGKQN